MTIAHLLEDFTSTGVAQVSPAAQGDDALEELRLAAFEQGYSAGWEDAVQKGTGADARFSEALTQTLQDLSFPFHELRGQMLTAMTPLFDCLSETLVPNLARAGLGPQLTALLNGANETLIDQPPELLVAKGRQDDFASLNLPVPVQISEDPCLSGDQIILRLGQSETALDRQALTQSVTDLIDTFQFDAQEDAKHG